MCMTKREERVVKFLDRRSETIVVRVPAELKQRAKKMFAGTSMSMSEYLRLALVSAVENGISAIVKAPDEIVGESTKRKD